MSSRNRRLSDKELPAANQISKALMEAARLGCSVSPNELEQRTHSQLASVPGLTLEYCALVHARTFEPLNEWTTERAVLLVAAFVGETRLIDNVVIP
jgi:pantoate--beta-alanine ligase